MSLYDGFLEKLTQKIDLRFSEIEAVHNFDLGPEFEIALCEILDGILPSRFGVCRGFIVERNGNRFGDDIIIYDRLRFPTIRGIGSNSFVQKEKIPFEAVYAYIEAKHNLDIQGYGKDPENPLKKAFDQINNIKSLRRVDRPFTQITDTCTLQDSYFKSSKPETWRHEIFNPIYTCIISRFISKDFSKKLDHLEGIFSDICKKKESTIDLIVAGKDLIMLPTWSKENKNHLSPFFGKDSFSKVQIVKNNALALGLFHLLWALSCIELGSMPWEDIIVDGLNDTKA